MLDQVYTLELLNPHTGLRQRAGSRKQALRIRQGRRKPVAAP
ncbi:MAG: hypothetical protein R2849_04415 [Thermomicrobiales bacterium]